VFAPYDADAMFLFLAGGYPSGVDPTHPIVGLFNTRLRLVADSLAVMPRSDLLRVAEFAKFLAEKLPETGEVERITPGHVVSRKWLTGFAEEAEAEARRRP
jgi:hypothetical protein